MRILRVKVFLNRFYPIHKKLLLRVGQDDFIIDVTMEGHSVGPTKNIKAVRKPSIAVDSGRDLHDEDWTLVKSKTNKKKMNMHQEGLEPGGFVLEKLCLLPYVAKERKDNIEEFLVVTASLLSLGKLTLLYMSISFIFKMLPAKLFPFRLATKKKNKVQITQDDAFWPMGDLVHLNDDEEEVLLDE
ncbi:hypothetical protein AMTR_s00100p00121010 [Amborella trichopoda]|uniref:Uncharacterized protein n=1 Tax=Amborella trichopoda TaxID=13333 RepID=W1NYH8_AMBTC|nr:hypothetical protein AMTR_s00100p00121010 [Amborella trichopoda]